MNIGMIACIGRTGQSLPQPPGESHAPTPTPSFVAEIAYISDLDLLAGSGSGSGSGTGGRLHLLDSQGKPLPGFNPISNVYSNDDAVILGKDRIGYYDATSTGRKDLFHLIDSKGRPITNFTPRADIENVQLSDSRMALLDGVNRSLPRHPGTLHVLDLNGQPILGFAPVPSISSVLSPAGNSSFFLSENRLIFLSHYDRNDGLSTLEIRDKNGNPIPNYVSIPLVKDFVANDFRIAYLSNFDPTTLTYTLYLMDDQGQPSPDFTPIVGVSELKGMNHDLLAYTVKRQRSQGGALRTDIMADDLYLVDLNGNSLIAILDFNLSSKVSFGSHRVSFLQNGELNILDSRGQSVVGPIQHYSHLFQFHKGHRIGNHRMGYIRRDRTGRDELFLMDLDGNALPGFSPILNVGSFQIRK